MNWMISYLFFKCIVLKKLFANSWIFVSTIFKSSNMNVLSCLFVYLFVDDIYMYYTYIYCIIVLWDVKFKTLAVKKLGGT